MTGTDLFQLPEGVTRVDLIEAYLIWTEDEPHIDADTIRREIRDIMEVPKPHNAEDTLRPYLRRLRSAGEDANLIGYHALEALDKALELLGVQR